MSVRMVLVVCALAPPLQVSLAQLSWPGLCSPRPPLGRTAHPAPAPPCTAPAAASSSRYNWPGFTSAINPGLSPASGLSPTPGLGCSGQFPVEATSANGLSPHGLTITSENVYEGTLSVAGELPFVSAVALEGVLPSAGAGAVSYSCGNGVAIESIAPAAGAAYAPAAAAYGLGLAATAPATVPLPPAGGCYVATAPVGGYGCAFLGVYDGIYY